MISLDDVDQNPETVLGAMSVWDGEKLRRFLADMILVRQLAWLICHGRLQL